MVTVNQVWDSMLKSNKQEDSDIPKVKLIKANVIDDPCHVSESNGD